MERKDAVVFLSIPTSLKDAVASAAEAEDQRPNDWIRATIKRALADRQRKAERKMARQGERAA